MRRYQPNAGFRLDGINYWMEPSPDGRWFSYEDVELLLKKIQQLEEEVDKLNARIGDLT